MTYSAARAIHLATLARLGWTVAAHLKVPHATRNDGLRLWFKPQAVYVSRGTTLGEARSLHSDPRTESTASLILWAEKFTR